MNKLDLSGLAKLSDEEMVAVISAIGTLAEDKVTKDPAMYAAILTMKGTFAGIPVPEEEADAILGALSSMRKVLKRAERVIKEAKKHPVTNVNGSVH